MDVTNKLVITVLVIGFVVISGWFILFYKTEQWDIPNKQHLPQNKNCDSDQDVACVINPQDSRILVDSSNAVAQARLVSEKGLGHIANDINKGKDTMELIMPKSRLSVEPTRIIQAK